MKKQQIIVLAIATLVSLCVLAALYVLSPLSKKMYRASFDRKFIDEYLGKPEAMMDVEVNSFYVAGYSDEMLYLGNSTAPFNLLTANLELTDSAHVILHVGLDSVVSPGHFKLLVAPPNFYLANGVQPVILKGDIVTWTAMPFMSDSNYFFTEAVVTGSKDFVLKSCGIETKEYDLARKTVNDFIFHNELLEKQIDGLFCVDGRLMFNKKLKQLVYLYYYRNEFIVADTNLSLNYRGRTIDPFSRAQIKVATIGDGNESMLGAPPAIVNGLSCTDSDFLYVQSNILAKNENINQFKSGSTIDCYRLTDGQYAGSFHIPKYKKENLMGFQVVNDKLFAVFGRYLVRFDLNPLLSDPPNGGKQNPSIP